jgi:acyl carrier protein
MESFEEIISHIQKWFFDKCGQTIDINEKYVDSGLIDSFDMIILVDFIEESYNIKFSSDDFQDERFFTISGLCKLILEKIFVA